jgi:hypothetical protein
MVTSLPDNILLEKFDLEPEEIEEAKGIIAKYSEKILHLTKYKEIRLEMRTHKKTKNNQFEIKGRVLFNEGKAVSEFQDVNPFLAIHKVFDKLLVEIEHRVKK